MAIFERNKGTVEAAALTREEKELQGQLALRETEANALHGQIEEAKGKLEDAALEAEASGNRKGYDAITRKIGDLQTELNIKLVAIAGTRKQLTAAKQALYVAATADRERKAIDFGKRRDKYAAMAAEAIATLHKAHSHVVELGREAADEFGPELTTRHAGTMIAAGEWLRALEIEIARVSSPGILPTATAVPALPGARTYVLGGNPANAHHLVKAMAMANAELVKRITSKPLPEAKAEKSKASPAAAVTTAAAKDPDDAILQGQSRGPTIDGNALALAMPHRKLA
jgi:hypothetical protein